MGVNIDLSQLGGQFSGARMGPCRVCRDITVLPAFGDGRCFGCTTSEIGETEWVPQKQVLVRAADVLLVQDEILELFEEAQRAVPAFKVIAGLAGPGGSVSIRRHSLWLPTNRRWHDVLSVRERVEAGLNRVDAIAAYCRDLRVAHKAAGLCVHCGSPVVPGLTICEKHRARTHSVYAKRKEDGVCLGCGGPRDTDKGTCTVCIQKRARTQAARAERLKAAGLCTACGKRPAEPLWCLECREKANAAKRTGPLPREVVVAAARHANKCRWDAVRKARGRAHVLR